MNQQQRDFLIRTYTQPDGNGGRELNETALYKLERVALHKHFLEGKQEGMNYEESIRYTARMTKQESRDLRNLIHEALNA